MAAEDNRAAQLGNELVKAAEENFSLLADSGIGGIADVKRLFNPARTETGQNDARTAVGRMKLEELQQQTSLHATGYYVNNVADSVAQEDGGSFDNRAYVGIEWDILKDGYLENKSNQELLKRDILIEELRSSLNLKKENFQAAYYHVIYTFNAARISMLEKRIRFLESYIDAAEKLYHYRLLPWEDIIRLRQDIAEAESLLRGYRTFNLAMKLDNRESVDAAGLAILDVDIQELLRRFDDNNIYSSITALENEKERNNHLILSNISMKAFLRYQMEDIISGSGSDNVLGGLYIKIPIPLRSYKQDIRGLERRLAAADSSKSLSDTRNRLLDAYYEYQHKLKDALAFHYKKELLRERLRREQTKKALADPTYNPLQTMNLANQMHAVEFEHMEVKQQLYLKLLEFHSHTGESFFESVSTVNMKAESRYRGSRSIYIWSHTFNRLENNFLWQYLNKQEIRTVILSTGENTDREKLKAFIAGLQKDGIAASALVGDKSLLFEARHNALINKIHEAKDIGFTSVHLDIEPHTFDDWHDRKAEYMNKYIETLSVAKKTASASGLATAVSIPTFYPPEYLSRIFEASDEVFIMAYETKDVEKIKERIKEESDAGTNKLTLAINAKDFATRFELEEFASALIKTACIERIALHDLGGLLSMEDRGMEAAMQFNGWGKHEAE